MGNKFALTDLVRSIVKVRPMHRKFIKKSVENLSVEELNELEKYLEYFSLLEINQKQLTNSYVTIVDDTFREELYFRKIGSYRFKTFKEAQSAVYDNESYMQSYMIGLALTAFLWENHTALKRFFKRQLPLFSKRAGLYREVGPGHGMYFIESMRHCNFYRYEGIDVSSTSVAMTKKLIDSGFFGRFPNANVLKQDFLSFVCNESAEVLVMGEVLEHVENPGAFLKRIYETTTSNPLVFITTCINAPAIDHLYNPGTIGNLEKLFLDYGFAVQDRCVVPRAGTNLSTCESQRLAINVAYLLGKL